MQNNLNNLELSEIIKRFENIEKNLRLDESRILRVPWWDLIRYPLFEEILKKKSNSDNKDFFIHNYLIEKLINIKRFLKQVSTLFSRKSALWVKNNSIVLWGNPRRKKENNFYTDIYSEPFIKLFKNKGNFVVIEKEIGFGHYEPTQNKNLYYGDQLFALAYLFSFFKIPIFKKKELLIISELENQIYKSYSVKINILKLAKKKIKRWLVIYPFMKGFFKYKKIKGFITVGITDNEAIIAAAKSLGINTLDLQHGSYARGKMNYDHTSAIKNSSFPNFVLTFGNFWSSKFSFPIKEDNLISFGYPYLNEKYDKYSHIKKENRLLIVSQGLEQIENGLVDFALKAKDFFPKNLIIEFRPHPSSFFKKKSNYFKKLRDNNVLISNKDADLYESFAKSRWQVGVFSTTLYEGLKFGVACFVLQIDRYQFMQELVDQNLARYIKSPKDIDLNWRLDNKKFNDFFSDISQKKINKVLSLFN